VNALVVDVEPLEKACKPAKLVVGLEFIRILPQFKEVVIHP
jgi:hypothetical protein